jgi:hypothetical protein
VDQLPPELIGRAIQDPEFRGRLLEDPEEVARVEGYALTQEQVEALRQLDSKAVDDAIAAMIGDLSGAKWG